ncbi:MAG: CinA family protein, partial [Bacteroidota bacterium]
LTAGTLAAKIVSVSGSSRYFMGSVSAYAVEIKERILHVPSEIIAQHGVVSAEVAMGMAEGVRKVLGTDVALATTGEAEATRTQPGEVWMGYADHQGTDADHAVLRYTRTVNMERAANYAMQFALKKVRTAVE